MNRARLRAIVGTTAIVAALTGSVVVAPVAEAKGMTLAQFRAHKTYPFPGGNVHVMSPAGYGEGSCMDYTLGWAWYHWKGVEFDHVKVAKIKSTALNRGYKVSTKPKQGAVGIWDSRGRHHAAYVLKYTSGGTSFTVRETHWDHVGPHNRTIKVSDIGRSGRAPDYFIYPPR